MKKISIILFVLVISAFSLYASFNVGVDFGYDFDFIIKNYNNDKVKYVNKGFLGDVTLVYNFLENLGIRGKIGASYYGKPTINFKSYPELSNTGLTYDLALDLVYTMNRYSFFDLLEYFGVELTSGYVYKEENRTDDLSILAFGLNLGFEAIHAFNSNLALRLGFEAAYFFLAKCPYLKPEGSNAKVRRFSGKFYIGTQYSF